MTRASGGIAIVFLLSVCAWAETPPSLEDTTRAGKAVTVAVWAAAAADLVATQRSREVATRLGQRNWEVNPVARLAVSHGWLANGAFNAAGAAGVTWGAWELRRKGHGRMARALELLSIGDHAWGTAYCVVNWPSTAGSGAAGRIVRER